MAEGRHYWEVQVSGGWGVFVGAVRPGLGHGRSYAGLQGKFAAGGRIGMLLDLGAGWMQLFRNGKRCGPGYTEGVAGPLVRAAQLAYAATCNGCKVTVLPGAVAPEGAGEGV